MDINYKLVLDSAEFTQSVQAGLTQLRQLNDELNKTKSTAASTFSQSALDTDKLADKMEEIVKINGQMLIEFQKLGTAIKSATSTSEIKQLNDEIAKLKKQIDGLSSTVGGGGGGFSGGLVKQMLQMKDRLIELRIAGRQNTEEYRKLNEQYSKLRANTLAVERDSKQYIKTNKELITSVNDTSQVAALAGANVISFGQVLSDIPYGIRGVANNLQQMTATMVMLIVQTGSAEKAMKALGKAFKGPLGIIVLIQGALAALDWYSNRQDKAKKSTEEATKANNKYRESLAEELSQMQILFGVAENLLKSGENYAKLKETATKINEGYNLQLNEENLTIQELHKAYTLVLDDIKNKIALEAASDSLKNAIEGELLAQDSINKAKARQLEIDGELKKLQPNNITLLQLAARGEQINKLKLEEQELQKKITALEANKEGHSKNQVIFYERALELAQKIRVENKKGDKEGDERLKSEETFAEQWAKLQAEQYELGVQLTEEYYLKKKNAAEIDRINGVITQEQYNKEIENLELSKFDALLNLSYEYGIDITQSEANLLAQITKMQKEAYDLQIKNLEDNYKEKKKLIDQDLLNGIITEKEYAKNIENLEAQKLEELLALAEKYNVNVTDADAALMAQRIKMYLAAKKEIEAKTKGDDKSKIAKLLGVEDKDVDVILKNIRIIAKSITEIFNEVNEAAQKNNKKVIENLQEVIDETEKKIETETELQQMGLANNLQGEQDYLAQQMALREEAFERQKQLELQKLAIDSISQLSNLITASTGIWNSTSKLPQPAGAILAIATIGAMFGSFAVSKAKAAQLVKSQESFEEGGVVQGKRHTQGGEKFYSSDGNHMVEIEQGEYVTNRESTSKYMDLLHAINNDEIGSHNIHKLLEGTGVTLPSVDTEIFRRDLKRATVGSLNESKQSETTQTDLSADIKDIKRYVKDIAEKETIMSDGNKTVVKQGSKTIITRRGN